MAEKNKNSSESKPSRKMRIINLAGYVTGKTHFRIPGLTNHIDKLCIGWHNENRRHLCHIMKFFNMGGFQIETFEELKQFVSKIEVTSDEISIREKKYLELANQLEKEITNYGLEGTGYNLYDVLFKLNNSVDEEEKLLEHINTLWQIKDIKEWKEYVYRRMKNGEIEPNSWKKWYILSVAKKQGISGEVIKKWRDLMNEAYKLRCNYEKARRRYKICNCLLFEMQNSDESKTLKEDLQWALREESDAYNPPDNLPDDYFLIKGGAITNLDQFIDIMELCIEKKIYLCLDIVKFKGTIIERFIGKTKFFEMLENATIEQIKKIVDIDVKINNLFWYCESTLDDFLCSSRNSKAVENIMACAVKDKESFLTTFLRPGFFLFELEWNHLQICVETFEKFLFHGSADSLWHLGAGAEMEFANALFVGLECCSDDIKTNNKKIDLGHIFPDWTVFFETITNNNSCWEYDDHCVELMSGFFNLLFKNIDKIKLDDKQMVGFLFGSIHDKYGYKVDGFMDVLRCEQKAATENNSDNELAKMAIVINAILKKQNLEYEDQDARKCHIQKWFENECKKIGINVSCNQDDIFFVNKTLYLVDKNVGVSQFDDGLVFLAYVYKNISMEKGQRYATLLGDYIRKNDYFDIYNYDKGNFIDDHYFFIICLLLNVLKNHNEAKAKINELYVDDKLSKWQKFCFMFYSFLIFHFIYFVKHEDVSRFISTITFNDNQNMISENEVKSSEISTVPESEIKTESTNQLNISDAHGWKIKCRS